MEVVWGHDRSVLCTDRRGEGRVGGKLMLGHPLGRRIIGYFSLGNFPTFLLLLACKGVKLDQMF